MGARAIRNVIINAHGERVGLLKYHAHAAAEQVYIHPAVNARSVKQHFPGDAAAFHQVVHAVQGFEQRGFSAAGRADESGDLVCTDVQIHIFKRMKIAVIQIEVVDRKFIHKFVTFALLKLFWRARRRAR